MLSRHGANVEVCLLPQTLPRVSEVIARHVEDIDADLLVMGAYGHSRFREAILGGATRNMLEHAKGAGLHGALGAGPAPPPQTVQRRAAELAKTKARPLDDTRKSNW
jgi:hypothetical protein